MSIFVPIMCCFGSKTVCFFINSLSANFFNIGKKCSFLNLQIDKIFLKLIFLQCSDYEINVSLLLQVLKILKVDDPGIKIFIYSSAIGCASTIFFKVWSNKKKSDFYSALYNTKLMQRTF